MIMNYQHITAIIRSDTLKKVETKLRDIGVPGLSVTKIKGYGEYANFYCDDWLITHARLDIFTDDSKAELIAEAIIESAHGGMEGDGIVAITPVQKLYHIRTRTEVSSSQDS
jgi:nitrogen regulatory protein P-II 1